MEQYPHLNREFAFRVYRRAKIVTTVNQTYVHHVYQAIFCSEIVSVFKHVLLSTKLTFTQ